MDNFELKIMGLIIGLTILTLGLLAIPLYYGSCKQASVYNRLNETNYTCSDFFWASDQINNQTQTINVNTK